MSKRTLAFLFAAALVAFLCSEDADFMQGQVVSPNGGQDI